MAVPVGVPERQAPGPTTAAAGGRVEGRSLPQMAWRRLRRDRAAMAGLGVVSALVLIAIFAPVLTWLNGYSPTQFNPGAIDPALGGVPKGPLGGIGAEHWLGVEPKSGRDIFSRLVYGARVSLLISVGATGVAVVLGTVFGIVAGYVGGWADAVIGRTMDVLLSFPSLIFMIALVAMLPNANRPLLLIVVIGFFGWSYVGRIVRGQTISLAQREFVEAARALGASTRYIVFRELLPNLAGPILVVATLTIPTYIAVEAALSFLGVGVKPPTPSWGQMLSDAVDWYQVIPSYFVLPGLCLFITVLSFNLLGDGLRDAIEPRGDGS
ncbi:MAG: ABC transporter permease subunit [Streptosporangiales bacterium]|nr:ABC transporter permease subunit [Streptosporangiales bacterium]